MVSAGIKAAEDGVSKMLLRGTMEEDAVVQSCPGFQASIRYLSSADDDEDVDDDDAADDEPLDLGLG